MKNNLARLCICALVATVFLVGFATPLQGKPNQDKEKLTAEQVVARHLQSLGGAETIASITGRVIGGTCKFSFRGVGTGQAVGDAVLASDGQKSVLGIAFGGLNDPGERVAFDGKKLTTSYIRIGVRSNLASFLMMHDVVFKEGLFAGSLSSAWPLLDIATRKPRLEYSGTKKVGDRVAYVLKYNPRGGSDFNISLFFDSETFQHVRTEYKRIVSAPIGQGVDRSAGVRTTRYEMTEEFGEFKKETGLVLPHSYKLNILVDNPSGTQIFDWVFDLTDFRFNQPVDVSIFKVG
ncbi:MAG: hypothetical protein H7Z16_17900 [Pyrinomonadaceae bacterium]|nr:hypothetical protein [Pyrinomonadaceae bacterium]